MITVINGDLDDALAVLKAKSRDRLEEFQRHRYFHPDRSTKKRPMKKRTQRKPGGRRY